MILIIEFSLCAYPKWTILFSISKMYYFYHTLFCFEINLLCVSEEILTALRGNPALQADFIRFPLKMYCKCLRGQSWGDRDLWNFSYFDIYFPVLTLVYKSKFWLKLCGKQQWILLYYRENIIIANKSINNMQF